MALTGAIYDYAKDELGVTWDALLRDRDEQFFVRRLTYVTQRYLHATLDETAQDALNVLVQVYLAKRLVLQIITPAIDYWSKQALDLQATGRSEVKSYKDRAADLKDLREQLLADVADLEEEVGPLIPVPRPKQPDVPAVRDIADAAAFTPDPNLMDPVGDITLNPNYTGGTT